jgi:hypothetical protein
MRIIAIDPGTTKSAYVMWDGSYVLSQDILDNEVMLAYLHDPPVLPCPLVIEQIRCYGMAIGQTTLDTVFWSGRFWEAWQGEKHLIPRMDVKMHLCKSARAKDSNVIQALIDRFAYGVRNRGKGTKAEPGFFYGFHDDIWQAMAVAVTWLDQQEK